MFGVVGCGPAIAGRAAVRQRSTALPGAMEIPNLAVPAFNYHYVRDRVLWRTELGTPREHDKSFNLGSVGP